MSQSIASGRESGFRSRLFALILALFVLPVALDSRGDPNNSNADAAGPLDVSAAAAAEPRIIGGYPVGSATRYPWMAALVSGNEADIHEGLFCGGTLIAPGWVVTAAHCVFDEVGRLAWNMDVVLGTVSLNALPGSYERIPVAEIIPHPAYDAYTADNDIALLRLEWSSAHPAIGGLTDPSSEPVPPTLLKAIGWGLTEPDGSSIPAQLQEVVLPLVSSHTCEATAGWVLSDAMLCAGYREGGRDTCQGDSGGPLFLETAATGHQLVGITSFGRGCAEADSYGVYARVSHLGGWVYSVLARYPGGVDPTRWVDFDGQVRTAEGTPLCALVLINGQHVFSCGQGGRYHLRSALDQNGDATLFAFADGFMPYRMQLNPGSVQVDWDFVMSRGDSAPVPVVALSSVAALPGGTHAILRGRVSNAAGVPLSALVLANGSFLFTPGDTGLFELTTVLNPAGRINLFAFADGFAPFKKTLVPTMQ